jgi:hypothetical protein
MQQELRKLTPAMYLHYREPIKGNELCSLACLLSATAVTECLSIIFYQLQAKNGITSAARAVKGLRAVTKVAFLGGEPLMPVTYMAQPVLDLKGWKSRLPCKFHPAIINVAHPQALTATFLSFHYT